MTNKEFSHERMLRQIGGWYLVLLIGAAQLIALLGAIPGILSIQINAEFDAQQLQAYSTLIPFLLPVTVLILLIAGYGMIRVACRKLNAWANTNTHLTPEDDRLAWREITGLAWRYGIAALIVIYSVDVLPLFLIAMPQEDVIGAAFQPAALNTSNFVYVLLGGTVSVLGIVILLVFLLDRFTLPLRLILLPTDFESQLNSRSGFLLQGKLLLIVLALLLIAVLLIAPIGFHQMLRVLYSEISAVEVIRALQIQSLLFSLLALTMGAGASYLISKAVSQPIHELIKTFHKIEGGDLKQRVQIGATDELGIVSMHFNRMVARLESLQGSLEQQVLERTRLLSASNEVGRVAASSLDPEQLLSRVIPLIHEEFGYYYAAIYLIDPSGKWAELKEASGEAGRVLKQNHHQLDIMGKSMVGAAIRERAPRIAQVASSEEQRFENPLLPYTRSEVSLPLMVGDRILGALNVHSTKEADFGPQAIDTLKNMAAQVAIALENARLFQDAQEVIRELSAVQQQYLSESWQRFSEENRDLEYRLGDESGADLQKLEVPIRLRDQILGQITLEGKQEWTPDQQSLVDAIATQAAVALENARLVSASRQMALRERAAAEISSKIWSSATIDGVLQTAIKELGRRLDASSAVVELHFEDTHEAEA